MLAQVRACDLIQRPSLVRVPGHEFGHIGLALDTGASGVIVPLVDNPDQAREAVKAAKFPPLGNRSFGGRRPIDLLGRKYSETANSDTLLAAQIESPEALANADAIAATPGVDALFLGPDDLFMRRGFSPGAPRPKDLFAKDIAAVASACRKHGKFAVTVASAPEPLQLCASAGFKLIVVGSDVSFLVDGSKQSSAAARALLKGPGPAHASVQV
jgi:4-hydroxy-2-oxoheptanedioate aldolase